MGGGKEGGEGVALSVAGREGGGWGGFSGRGGGLEEAELGSGVLLLSACCGSTGTSENICAQNRRMTVCNTGM